MYDFNEYDDTPAGLTTPAKLVRFFLGALLIAALGLIFGIVALWQLAG